MNKKKRENTTLMNTLSDNLLTYSASACKAAALRDDVVFLFVCLLVRLFVCSSVAYFFRMQLGVRFFLNAL